MLRKCYAYMTAEFELKNTGGADTSLPVDGCVVHCILNDPARASTGAVCAAKHASSVLHLQLNWAPAFYA